MQFRSMKAKMLGTVSAFALVFCTSQALSDSPGAMTSPPSRQQERHVADADNDTENIWNTSAATTADATSNIQTENRWRTMVSLVQSAQAAAGVAAHSATKAETSASPDLARKANVDAQIAAETAMEAASKVRILAEKHSRPTEAKNAILAAQKAALSAQVDAEVASVFVAEKTTK